MSDQKSKGRQEPKKRAKKYEEKLKIEGDFDEVLKIAARPPKKKTGKKEE